MRLNAIKEVKKITTKSIMDAIMPAVSLLNLSRFFIATFLLLLSHYYLSTKNPLLSIFISIKRV